MRLSELFKAHVVITDDYAHVARLREIDDGTLELVWNDEGVLFDDQEIEPFDQSTCTGMFSVNDTEGETRVFITVQEAKLP